MTTTKADATALARALNDYARAADQEATNARRKRDEVVRQMYADGHSAAELAALLDVSRQAVHKITSK